MYLVIPSTCSLASYQVLAITQLSLVIVDTLLLMQLLYLNLTQNVLTGTLPGSWSNLTSVSNCQCDSMFFLDHIASTYLKCHNSCNTSAQVLGYIPKLDVIMRLPAWICIACYVLWHTMWKCKVQHATLLVYWSLCKMENAGHHGALPPRTLCFCFSSHNKDCCCSWYTWVWPKTFFLGHYQALGVVSLRQVTLKPQGQALSHMCCCLEEQHAAKLEVGVQ